MPSAEKIDLRYGTYLQPVGRSRTTVGRPRPPLGYRSGESFPAGIIMVNFRFFMFSPVQSDVSVLNIP